MNNLFNKKFILILLALICIMQNFSVLKSMGNALRRMGTPKTRNKRRKQKRREKEKTHSMRMEEENSAEKVRMDCSISESESERKELSDNKRDRLRSVYSQLMPSFYAATSFAVKRAILIVMITVFIFIMTGLHPSDIYYILYGFESFSLLECPSEVDDSFIIGPFSTDFPPNIIELCIKDPNNTIYVCRDYLTICEFDGCWNSIVNTATSMCKNFAWCTSFLDMLPKIIKSLDFLEAFDKCKVKEFGYGY